MLSLGYFIFYHAVSSPNYSIVVFLSLIEVHDWFIRGRYLWSNSMTKCAFACSIHALDCRWRRYLWNQRGQPPNPRGPGRRATQSSSRSPSHCPFRSNLHGTAIRQPHLEDRCWKHAEDAAWAPPCPRSTAAHHSWFDTSWASTGIFHHIYPSLVNFTTGASDFTTAFQIIQSGK